MPSTAQTAVGTVHIEYKIENGIPDREYQVNVTSQLGRISGFYIHGTNTSIITSMGDITASLLPFASDAYESEITTATHAGRQEITVLPPHSGKKNPMRRIDANHRSEAGSVEVRYPSTWEGVVEAQSDLGSVSVGGKDLRIIKEHRGMGGFVEAEKGKGEGTTSVRTARGAVKFVVDG